MTAPAAIDGQLVDMRNVSAHKCVRLVIDIPAERALEVTQAFGWPTMVDPVPVAIARLRTPPVIEGGPPNPAIVSPAKRDWSALTPAQQAGILCNQKAFWTFTGTADAESAAQYVRGWCDVKSRAELNTNPEAAESWRRLDGEYFAWMRGVE